MEIILELTHLTDLTDFLHKVKRALILGSDWAIFYGENVNKPK